jgi:hypothetical protein
VPILVHVSLLHIFFVNSVKRFHVMVLSINRFHENWSTESHSVFKSVKMLKRCALLSKMFNIFFQFCYNALQEMSTKISSVT